MLQSVSSVTGARFCCQQVSREVLTYPVYVQRLQLVFNRVIEKTWLKGETVCIVSRAGRALCYTLTRMFVLS